jgi:uncharacterized protein YhdP
MRDWASTAPLPLKKQMGTPMSGQVTLKTFAKSASNSSRFTWDGKINDAYFIQGELGRDGTLRQAIGIGTAAPLPAQGLQLNLSGAELNLDSWQDFLESSKKKIVSSKTEESNTSNIQIAAQIKKVILLDRKWPDLNFSASNKNTSWQMRINSPSIAGQLQYIEGTKSQPSGLISGRLARLKFSEEAITPIETAKSAQKIAPKKAKINPNSVPSLDIVIDDFAWLKEPLGQIKIKTKTSNNVLAIESLQINNPQGNGSLSGKWAGASQNQAEHTNLNGELNIKDAGQIIAHWSDQKSVEGGQGKLTVNADWDGSPFDPKYDTLAGKVILNLEKGRLLEVNTSGAKLLDVLSLQSLFRFATFDLKGSLGNIVTKGTPFNNIDASFDVNAGVAQTKQFTMSLDQARVAMSGQINIPKKTQDLRITIFPTIDATAGSLAAFAINPIVGLGALVGQYLITSQINRNLQSDYLVQGSWDNPEVIPLDQKGQPIDAKTLDTIRSKNLLKEQSKPGDSNSGVPTKTSN